MTIKILAVDDEPRFNRLVEANLATEGFEVITAKNGAEAIEMMVSESPDMVLLDVMMPDMDGFTVLDRIREFSSVPVIMLTAKGKEADRVEGLNRGADDYIVKPFSANELLARVRAVLRRTEKVFPPGQSNIFTHGDLKIDYAKAEVTNNNEAVLLSATEYRLLLHFAHNAGKTISAEELLSNVWGEEYKTDKEILWVCISRLRQKLEYDPKKPEHITTRSGVGYLMPRDKKET
ncbi:MAG: response regulator transcription factor [Chloroflexi bacterium]|jgi:DNA-binding response OmpR family regulator|nr:response regulator transcription factor [Chloroflexota bacterium]MBT3669737.1 response regulator transcription factor [Chloroflexota bacterium]MBT4003427.1 response regulator transcription factor [Chloroflexota bacterium]MBT4305217.1 response regulator transcription factor [Chloroflexota bacterium]MBT4534860.1 response regulator transcription factor [Chloroflexota bacterium]